MEKFQVYGDESISGDRNHVIYGLLIAPDEVVPVAEQRLGAIKIQFGGALTSRFHCRELLNPHARLKSDWKHLNDKEALELVGAMVNTLGGIGLKTRIGYVNKKLTPSIIPPIRDADEMGLSDPKQLVPFAFYAALGQLLIDPIYHDNCKLWISPESSVISWFGNKRQVDRLLRLNRVDPLAKYIEAMLTPVNAESKECPLLLEAADLLAYTAQRKFTNAEQIRRRKSDHLFETAFELMSPAVSQIELLANEHSITGVMENYAFRERN